MVASIFAAAMLSGAPVPAAPTTLNATSSNTGWAAQSAAVLTTANYPEAHPSGATSGLSMQCLLADTFVGARSTALPGGFRLADAPLVGMWIYWTATQGSVELRFTSDNFVSKTKTFGWSFSGQIHSGWNLLTVRPDGLAATNPGGATWTVAGGFLDTDVVNGLEIRISTNGAALTEVFYGGIFYHPAVPTKGAVMMGFDRYEDTSIYTLALPILANAGMFGYAAGDTDKIATPGANRTQIQNLYNAGWDIISQGPNHTDYTASPGNLSADYDASKAVLDGLGLTRASKLFAYPFSANNATTDATLTGKGCPIARSGWAWAIHPNEYNAGPKLIGHGAVNMGGKTLTTMKNLVDQAATYGVTLNFFTHGLTAGGDGTTPPADTLLWYANDYQSLVDYLVVKRSANLIYTQSPTQWLRSRKVSF